MKKTSVLLILVVVQILFVLSPVQADAAAISGQVTAADGGAGIEGVQVRVYDSNNNFPSVGSDFTDENGDFTVTGLPSGDYKVQFYAGNTGYFHEWYNDKTDFDSADPVTVTDPGTTPGIDAVLEPSGSISGQVTDGSAGIAGINVRVHGSTTGYLGDATTDSNGNYTVSGLPSGNLKVQFYASVSGYISEWYNDKADFGSADQVAVTAPNTTAGIDAVLEHGGSISGQVTDEIAGIAGITVQVYDENDDTIAIGSGSTDSNGDYTVTGLPSGDYKVEFDTSGTGYSSQWYNDKADFASADPVTVTAPNPTAGIDAVLEYGGSISGQVTDGSAGIAGITVRVYDENDDSITIGSGSTDSNGDYTVTGLPSGVYKVEFDTSGTGYSSEWYNDKADFSSADPVTVTAPGLTDNIDADLEATGSISGQVTDGIAGIAGITVRAYDSNNVSIGSDSTDSNGDYTVTGLPSGDYKVEFDTSGTGYSSQWYNDKADFASADPVTVTAPDDTPNINAVLQTFGDELAADFGTSGLYFYNGARWTRLSTGNPQWLTAYSGKLTGDFGASGLYQYNGGAWTRLTVGDADNSGNTMAAFSSGLAVDFGTSGLYLYKGAGWTRISTANPQWLTAYSGKLAVDFGTYGLWKYDGAWTKISTGSPDNSGNTMAAYAGGLAVDFGASGLYFYNGAGWTKISTANVDWLTSYGGILAADFGAYGLWKYDGAWTKISTGNPDNGGNTMAAYDGGLAVDFGASGLYLYKGAGWTRITTANPQWLTAYSDKLAVDFGASGMWEYGGSGWTKITTGNADNSGNTMIDW